MHVPENVDVGIKYEVYDWKRTKHPLGVWESSFGWIYWACQAFGREQPIPRGVSLECLQPIQFLVESWLESFTKYPCEAVLLHCCWKKEKVALESCPQEPPDLRIIRSDFAPPTDRIKDLNFECINLSYSYFVYKKLYILVEPQNNFQNRASANINGATAFELASVFWL